LRLATETAIDHTIETLESTVDSARPVPQPILSQARLAARRRVPLETMLRRYLAGHAVLGDFVIEEAERRAVSPTVLRRVLRSQAATTDQVLATISATYLQEAASARPRSAGQRQTECVRRLLDGELIDPSGLDYDFDRWHVALVLRGSGKSDAVDAMTDPFDARRLVVAGDEGFLWVWMGSRDRLESRWIEEAIPADLRGGLRVGIGEPGEGRGGWRLTHEQGRAALSVAVRASAVATRYADVALLVSVMKDELASTSLRQLYLAPLEEGRDRGTVLRETLRAYFAARGNLTSAAAALAVDRRTVSSRLRVAEERIGGSLDEYVSDLEIALQFDQFDRSRRA
jgi:hypothetical protein